MIRGCEVVQVPHQQRRFCFVVKHKNRQPLYLSSDKEKLMFGKKKNKKKNFKKLFLTFSFFICSSLDGCDR